MEEVRIIVAGSRNFTDQQLLAQTLSSYLEDKSSNRKIQFVSGTARGADSLGEQFAREHGYEVRRFPAQWDIYGRSAGYRRNAEMAEYAAQETGVLFAFWDGESRGTTHIDLVASMTSTANAKLLRTLAEHMSPYAMANGEGDSVVDVTAKLLHGTSLEEFLQNLQKVGLD